MRKLLTHQSPQIIKVNIFSRDSRLLFLSGNVGLDLIQYIVAAEKASFDNLVIWNFYTNLFKRKLCGVVRNVFARRKISWLLLNVLPVVLRVHLVLNRSKFHDCLGQLIISPIVNVHTVVYNKS